MVDLNAARVRFLVKTNSAVKNGLISEENFLSALDREIMKESANACAIDVLYIAVDARSALSKF